MSDAFNQNDVLFGVQTVARRHIGNKQFRSIVESKKDEYQAASYKEKRTIAIQIIQRIETMDPPGKFLVEDKKGGEVGWVPAEREKTIKKVLHCLREKKKIEQGSVSGLVGSNDGSPLLQLSDQGQNYDVGMKDKNDGLINLNVEHNRLQTNSGSPLSDISTVIPNNCIHLRDWIRGAIDEINASTDDASSHASTSSRYITPALKIAFSLADQICNARESITAGVTDWADQVAVHLEPSGSGSFLNVSTVTSLLLLAQDATNAEQLSETRCIYVLAMVFCELFSGGRAVFDAQTDDDLVEGTIDFANDLTISNDSGTYHEQRKKGRPGNINQITLPIDATTLNGLPAPLFDLITNMLDCMNGDLGGNESYRCLSDVRDDLKLMIDKPSKFLAGLDVKNTLTVSGLQLNNFVYGQHQELSALKDCYSRSLSFRGEFAIINGPSGSGKTVLANRFAQFVVSTGGVFIQEKFDRLQQATPFTAIADAFNEYCNMLIFNGESEYAAEVASSLREKLGLDACYLTEIRPNASMIFGDLNGSEEGKDCDNAQQRIRYLLCQFVEIISNVSSCPIVLFLDDVQWIDAASLAVINQLLLLSPGFTSFFFIGSYCDDEVGICHPVSNMIANVRTFKVNAKTITMGLMNKENVNEIISEILCLSPRLTGPLAEIVHHKTKGNPLFVSQLMVALSKEGLLYISLSRRRWEWNEEKIQTRKIPNDVAEFLTGTIGRLPQGVQSALRTLSCFGISVDISVIKILETELGLQLERSLDAAKSEGFLDMANGKYRFSHDIIQESAYFNLMTPEERRLEHSRFGLALFSSSFVKNDDSLMFVAADQINIGGNSVIFDANQGSLMAQLNFRAGSKAMEMSNFSCALQYFEHGISFLWENHWRDHYDLSLKLFEKAAQCCHAVGDRRKLEVFSKEVLSFAKSFDEKLNVLYVTISSLFTASMFEKAVSQGKQALSELGEGISGGLSRPDSLMLIEMTRRKLHGLTDDDLRSLSHMTSKSMTAAMKILSKMLYSAAYSSPNLLPALTVKMIDVSLTHGLTSISAISFAYFGNILSSAGNMKEGYRYSKFAIDLARRFDSKEVTGEVYLASTPVISYVEQMQTSREIQLKGHVAAMSAGNTSCAAFNSLFYCNWLFLSGAKLDHVVTKYQEAMLFIKQYDLLPILTICQGLLRGVSILISSDTPRDMSLESCHTKQKQQELVVVERNQFVAHKYFYQKMYDSFFFRQYDVMKFYSQKFVAYNDMFQPFVLLNMKCMWTLILGLVSFWIYRESNYQIWLERGVAMKDVIKNWAETASEWNFLQKLHLLEAEEHFCNGQHESAKESYNKAIMFAKKHKFINDEALACELAGHFYFEIGEKAASLEYFTRAHEKYASWGAYAKASTVFELVQSLVHSTSPQSDQNEPTFLHQLEQSDRNESLQSGKRSYSSS